MSKNKLLSPIKEEKQSTFALTEFYLATMESLFLFFNRGAKRNAAHEEAGKNVGFWGRWVLDKFLHKFVGDRFC